MEDLKQRNEIAEADKWRLEDIFPNEELWEADFKKAKEAIEGYKRYKGRIETSAAELLACLKHDDEASLMVERLYVYAHLRKDEDTRNPKYQALEDRARGLYVEAGSASSYVAPSILAISDEKLASFYEEAPELLFYKKMIDETVRNRAHALNAEQEETLAQLGEVAGAAGTIFGMINDADMKFGTMKGENGEDIQLTKGRYIQLLESKSRKVREGAFKAMYEAYGKQINTLAATLSANVKKNAAFAKIRKHESALAKSLNADNIKQDVYDNLIAAVKKNLPLMHRYVSLRKKMLGLEELRMYDLYVPMVEAVSEDKMTYDEAYATMLEGLAPLGEEYKRILLEAKASGWIDVRENEGKRGGAYCSGCYGTHPYVLLNFNGTMDAMFTLAHEMGHALHSYYSDKNQPYAYAQYKIFVAEVASTVNEILLMRHLLSKTEDKSQKIHLVNEFLEKFRGTVYRQTMFAEFEKIIHAKAEAGEALTAEALKEIYKALNAEYYGPEAVLDEEIALEWSRIPHFYTSFYVYKYATGFSAAAAIAKAILEEGEPAVRRYLEFLKSGGSDYPIELLKKAGVNMAEPKPVEGALAYFGELLAEMENLNG